MPDTVNVKWAVYGSYAVSDHGDVKRIKANRCRVGRILSQADHYGYRCVNLCEHGKATSKLVHRLVCELFVGAPPSERHCVNHKNGIRFDNRAENLEWVTYAENNQHTIDILNRRSNAILTHDKANEIRAIYSTGLITQYELSETFDVDQALISDIVNNKRWVHAS